ncbi:hypothetical protein CLLI_06050 [Clostridium liquoris]|jgi:hypothetical protein|uniref:Helix-turn-helix domain protein n=1 Tax=Clostridium liquoris TaxID=1289519 RepID=A0A2T0B7M4_9CLOT|nr:helix-turn-helix domain-containing protein [Clostridium liquoris]PRR79872.1 hypothetical protein CLLI_06050 [Clostridium liquoris]
MKNVNNATNNIENNEAINNATELKIPRMVPIQTVADECGFSYKTLWKMCKENQIVYIKAGNKYLINFDKFIEFLNTGVQE